MKEKTNDIVSRSVGEVGKTEAVIKKLGKKFNTGREIAEECEQYEELISREGTDIVLGRINKLRTSSDGADVNEPKADDINIPRSNS